MERVFNSLDETYRIIFISLSAVICGVGVIGNFLVLLTFVCNKSTLLSPSIILLATTSLSDFLCAVIAGPILCISNRNGKWPFGETTCTFYGFCMTLFGLINLTHLTAVAVERFIAFEKSFLWNKLTVKNMFIMSGVLVFYCLIFAVAPVLGWSSYTLEGPGTSCSINWQSDSTTDISYHITLFIFCFFLPVIILITCYVRVCRATRKITERAKQRWGNESLQVQASALAEKKLTVIIVMMSVAFLFAWTPYAVVSFISIIGYPELISPLAAAIPSYLAKTSVMYNPVIYFFKYRRFRVGLKNCIPRCLVNILQRKSRVLPCSTTDNN